MADYVTYDKSDAVLNVVTRLRNHHDHLKTLDEAYAFMRKQQTYNRMNDEKFAFDDAAMDKLDKSYFTSLIVRLSKSEGDALFSKVEEAYRTLKDLVLRHHPKAKVEIYFDSAHITIKSILDHEQQAESDLYTYIPVIRPVVHKWLSSLGPETKLYANGLFTNVNKEKGLSVGIRFFPNLPLIQIIRGEVGKMLYSSSGLTLRSEDDFHTMLTHSTGFRARQLTTPFPANFTNEFKQVVEQYEKVLFGSIDNVVASDVFVRNGFSDKMSLGKEISIA